MKLYGIVGAGGFGREVMPVAAAMLATQFSSHEYELVFLTEDKVTRAKLNHHSYMTIAEFLAHSAKEKFFNIAIANYEIRKRIAEDLIQKGIQPFSIAALNYLNLTNNQIAEGSIFCPFTMVTANAKIGKFFHANIYSYIAHDCIIGDYVTFAPHVQCNGGVIIEDYVYVGSGVIFKQGTATKPIIIGTGAILGMGAVITKSVAPYDTVVGNPAKSLKIKEAVQ